MYGERERERLPRAVSFPLQKVHLSFDQKLPSRCFRPLRPSLLRPFRFRFCRVRRTSRPWIHHALTKKRSKARAFGSIRRKRHRPRSYEKTDAGVMNPSGNGTGGGRGGNQRKKPNLSPIPLPKRDISLAVPLPLPPTATAPPSSSPIAFSDLQKVQLIGCGNGGKVYLMRHTPTNASYALKVIYGNHGDAVRRQIWREIEILRTTNSPHLVRCMGMFDNGGEIQVLLEYMDGGSLEGKRFGESEIAVFSRQILKGLDYLHRQKRIVHRDIKPSNLLINGRRDGVQVKIADFGVSRILAQTMDPCRSSVGTIAYMSPERINTDLNEGN